MSDKNSILLVYLNEAISSAQAALAADSSGQLDNAVAMFGKAAASLSKAKLFGSEHIQRSLATLTSTYQLRIQDLNNPAPITVPIQPHPKDENMHLNDDNMDIQEAASEPRQEALLLKNIAGLEKAKQILLEAIILPRRFPYLYTNLKPSNKILLYGPPGTGKTKLVQAIAAEAQVPVISITAADVLSKWFGASERLVKQMFQQAREKNAILFVDEIDSLLMKRTDNEDENTRRIKNEFLLQMDGYSESALVACTNRPWDLDLAVLRRFQKKLYIPLPNEQGRRDLLRIHLSQKCDLDDDAWKLLTCMTEGLSGSDISMACQEALQAPIRELVSSKHFKEVHSRQTRGKILLIPCKESDPGAVPISLLEINNQIFNVTSRPICKEDIFQTIGKVHPSVPKEEIQKYEDYTAMHGERAD